MSSRYQERGMGFGDGTDMFIPLLTMWNPFLLAGAEAPKSYGLVKDEFGAIASEWQAFVGHRLQEDVALMQRLTQCRTPDQIAAAYSDFWRKAAEDYGKQFTTMTKLMTGVTNKMVVAVQSAADEASKDLSPRRNAA
jgi:Phasin protein